MARCRAVSASWTVAALIAEATAYWVLPGFAGGAVAISCFLVADEVEAEIVVRGTRWSVYGLARVRDLGALGHRLIATNVYDGDELLPLSDRHVDVIVCTYPPGTPPYGSLARQDRARLRASIEDRFATVLRAFDPRRTTGGWAGIR